MKLLHDFGIRALLATIAVGGTTIAGVYLVFHGKEELGMSTLGGLAMAAVAFYFAQHSSTPPPNGAPPAR